jgi:FtsH-binding integral membrane protein
VKWLILFFVVIGFTALLVVIFEGFRYRIQEARKRDNEESLIMNLIVDDDRHHSVPELALTLLFFIAMEAFCVFTALNLRAPQAWILSFFGAIAVFKVVVLLVRAIKRQKS